MRVRVAVSLVALALAGLVPARVAAAGLPMEIEDVERVMREPGLADAWKSPASGAPFAIRK